MFSIVHPRTSRLDRVSRREWLQIGSLSAAGISLTDALRAGEPRPGRPDPGSKLAGDLGSTFGRAKNVIYLWLQGGPPQHETFDPKPDAPAGIRGEFDPASDRAGDSVPHIPGHTVPMDEDGRGLNEASSCDDGAQLEIVRQEIPLDRSRRQSRQDSEGGALDQIVSEVEARHPIDEDGGTGLGR